MGILLREANLSEHCTGSRRTLNGQKKHQGRAVWVLGMVPQRLQLYLLMTFDQSRGSLELQLHGRHWEEHYLQPGLVLINTSF